MAKKKEEMGITIAKNKDMAEWYGEVVFKSGLADYAPVKGCMVIRPYGYAIWQAIMDHFNNVLKQKNVENAYFPLFIPEAFFEKEKQHAKGFEPEVAWVLNKDDAKEKLALRPTSETIMYDSYSKWIRSWRDLPLRINQWCNIIRWEVKDVKMFLRSREFLWQEGHCVYETEQECENEAIMYLKEYQRLSTELLAIPTMIGEKTEKERFAGAKKTFTIEAFMPDGKALQMGTSHNLGQGFGKAFNIEYLGKDEKKHTPWQNSWGFSTRLIGALVLLHGDDKGLILPPNAAPIQVVIVPILYEETRNKVLKEADKIANYLSKFRTKLDDRDGYSPGWKFNEWEVKGVPLRIEIGPKDVNEKKCVLVRRDTGKKIPVLIKDVKKAVEAELKVIQKSLYNKALKHVKDNTVNADNWKDFIKAINNKKLVHAYFCGKIDCEDLIKFKTKGATSRCTPFDAKTPVNKKCVHCGKQAVIHTYFAKNY